MYRKGSTGEGVKEIQRKVGATVDGIYGPETEQKVREFQKDRAISPDGIVGPITISKLNPSLLEILRDANRKFWNVMLGRSA